MLRRVGSRLTAGVMLLSPGALIPTAQAQRVTGHVYDSLATGGYLGHATLWIAGTALQTSTDAAGRFQFDSVPPGSHQIALEHPVFDSLGLSPTTWRIEVPSAGRDDLLLAVPSAARALGQYCETPPTPGAGFVFGWVTDPGTDRPLAGVRVHAAWSEVAVSTTGVHQAWQYRRATSDSGGHYVLCGLPREDGSILVWATLDSVSTGQLVVELSAARPTGRPLLLSPRADARGRLEGTVRNADGARIPGARVLVRRGQRVTETDPSGRFVLDPTPVGSQVLEVAAIGFEPYTRELALRPGRGVQTDVVLAQTPQVLPGLVSVGRLGTGRAASTFLERSRRGFGYYITAAQIERRAAFAVEDLLQQVPGLRVIRAGGGYRVESGRASGFSGSCSPAIYLDGSHFPLSPAEGDQIPVAISDVAGIEVYTGIGGAPIEFQGGGCGVVAIWTRRGGAEK